MLDRVRVRSSLAVLACPPKPGPSSMGGEFHTRRSPSLVQELANLAGRIGTSSNPAPITLAADVVGARPDRRHV